MKHQQACNPKYLKGDKHRDLGAATNLEMISCQEVFQKPLV